MKLSEIINRPMQSLHGRTAIQRLRQLEASLVSPSTRLAIPFMFRGPGFFKSIRPMQSQEEIAGLYSLVSRKAPKVVVEIGTCHGGTLYLWCQAAAADATLISIDLPGGQFGGGYRECRSDLYRGFRREGQTLHLLRADSHSAETATKVGELTGGRPIDFLFVDGDHTYAGVKRDFELYSPLVADGGLIALHDIAPRAEEPSIEVWKFWQEVRSNHPDAQEWLDRTPGGRPIGIGLLHWRRS